MKNVFVRKITWAYLNEQNPSFKMDLHVVVNLLKLSTNNDKAYIILPPFK